MAYREGVLCFIEISSPLGSRGSLPFGAHMARFPPKESSFKNSMEGPICRVLSLPFVLFNFRPPHLGPFTFIVRDIF